MIVVVLPCNVVAYDTFYFGSLLISICYDWLLVRRAVRRRAGGGVHHQQDYGAADYFDRSPEQVFQCLFIMHDDTINLQLKMKKIFFRCSHLT